MLVSSWIFATAAADALANVSAMELLRGGAAPPGAKSSADAHRHPHLFRYQVQNPTQCERGWKGMSGKKEEKQIDWQDSVLHGSNTSTACGPPESLE